MESPRDPLPADVSAEPEPADPPPTEPLHLGEPAEPLPPGDADLIAASRAGDAAAYDTLYRRHVASAHSLARQLVRNRAEADDVVAETFAKILDLLHRGGGPDDAFRPYLLTAVRRSAYDRHRAERRQLVTDEMETFDRGVPFADPAVADLERTMIARAFASLPERWQAVLWHTEVEGARPADVAPLLGLTANGVAALAYRAREGLRQAYLADRPGDTVALSGPVVWAGLYWAWTGGPSQAAIALRAPGGSARHITGTAASAPLDLGFGGLARIPVHQAFAEVTGLVAQYGSGAWSATAPAPAGWPRGPDVGQAAGAGYLGWTLVVMTRDPAAPPGQVMVLDGARPVDAAHHGFSAPLDGLLAGQVVRVHAVDWTMRGPRFSAFAQPLSAHPAVSFPAMNAPYLVGVVTAAAPLVPPAPPAPTTPHLWGSVR